MKNQHTKGETPHNFNKNEKKISKLGKAIRKLGSNILQCFRPSICSQQSQSKIASDGSSLRLQQTPSVPQISTTATTSSEYSHSLTPSNLAHSVHMVTSSCDMETAQEQDLHTSEEITALTVPDIPIVVDTPATETQEAVIQSSNIKQDNILSNSTSFTLDDRSSQLTLSFGPTLERINSSKPLSHTPGTRPDRVDCLQPLREIEDIAVQASASSKMFGLGPKHFELGSKLGEGGMGEVFEAKCIMDIDPENCAGKSLDVAIKKISNADEDDIAREVHNHQKVCGHKNIVSQISSFESGTALYIVLERLHGPNLFQVLCRRGLLFERQATNIMIQVFAALTHLHSKGVAHLDVKPANIMYSLPIDTVDIAASNIQLVDFGLSHESQSEELAYTKVCARRCGTLGYTAPEIFEDGNYSPGYADIWSAGVMFYELLTGCLPYDGDSIGEMNCKIVSEGNLDLRSNIRLRAVSAEIKFFLNWLLELDSEKRPRAKEAFFFLSDLQTCPVQVTGYSSEMY